MKVSQSNSRLTSTNHDNKTNKENVNSVDQEDHILNERDELKNDLTEIGPYYVADSKFSKIHEPFLQKIGVSQTKIEKIYDFYIEATMEIININANRLYLEDYELIEVIIENYDDYVMEVLGETDGETYKFYKDSFTERRLTNELNNNLDNENQLDNDQLEKLTKEFFNIREKYYDIEYQAGAGAKITGKFEGNQSPEEINALIKNEYIKSAEDNLTEPQFEMLKNILNNP
jgi:hypothetical protein